MLRLSTLASDGPPKRSPFIFKFYPSLGLQDSAMPTYSSPFIHFSKSATFSRCFDCCNQPLRCCRCSSLFFKQSQCWVVPLFKGQAGSGSRHTIKDEGGRKMLFFRTLSNKKKVTKLFFEFRFSPRAGSSPKTRITKTKTLTRATHAGLEGISQSRTISDFSFCFLKLLNVNPSTNNTHV